MNKLLVVNITCLFFNILKSKYANNEMCITASNSHRSHFFTSNGDVLQRGGGAFSPILFNLYASDLQSYLSFGTEAPLLDASYVTCLVFAVDLVLVSRLEERLQGLIDKLHGPSMFAVKAKIYAALYNPASSIDFDETSSYWSAPKSS